MKTIGTASDDDAYYLAAYGYDGFGRLDRVRGPGLPSESSFSALYSFDPNSDLVDKLDFNDSFPRGSIDWSYEAQRDLIASIENRYSTTTQISKYTYANDRLGRRASVVRTGWAFASNTSGHMDKWGYNDRNELTSSKRYAGLDPNSPGTADPNLDRTYEYDPIGNRTLSRRGTDPNSTYERNNVHQYETITTTLSPIETVQELKYDPDGNLTEALTLGDVDGDGDVDQDDIDAVLFAYGTCEGDESYNPRANFDATATCDGDPNLQTIDQDDLDVVLFYFGLPSTGSIRARMAWDGENRLSSWEALVPGAGSKKVTFKYDYMGRRSEKAVYDWDPNLNGGDGGWSGSPSTQRRYVWRGWLRLMELDGSGNVLRKWTWGRDLSGTLEGAGGIGGLLAVRDANDTPSDPNDDMKYVYFYDANGNVGQVVDLFGTGSPSGVIKARYEYDAYGNVTYSTGSYAAANAVRFSTKVWDDETGMGDWGYRYYDQRLGRWVGRDPLEEGGGTALYLYVENGPASHLDSLGLTITIEGDKAFEDLVNKCLAQLERDPELAKLIRTLRENKHDHKIRPVVGNIPNCTETVVGREDDTEKKGVGGPSIIKWRENDANAPLGPRHPCIALMHELVHAYVRHEGLRKEYGGNTPGGGPKEEEYAVQYENRARYMLSNDRRTCYTKPGDIDPGEWPPPRCTPADNPDAWRPPPPPTTKPKVEPPPKKRRTPRPGGP